MGFRGLKDLRLTGHIICLANLVLIPYSSMFVKGFNPPNYCIRKPGLQRRITAKAQREMLLLMDQVIFRDYRDVSVVHTGPKVPFFRQKLKCENKGYSISCLHLSNVFGQFLSRKRESANLIITVLYFPPL